MVDSCYFKSEMSLKRVMGRMQQISVAKYLQQAAKYEQSTLDLPDYKIHLLYGHTSKVGQSHNRFMKQKYNYVRDKETPLSTS